MKKLILAGLLGLTLVNASESGLGIGIGTGYIDNNYKNIIVKFEKTTNIPFNIGGKLAKNYIKSFVVYNYPLLLNRISLIPILGFEKYKIKDKNEIQEFINCQALIFNETRFIPIANFQVGTKSINAEMGIFIKVNPNINFEYELGKRWLYKKIENKKNTINTAIYINYFF